MYAVIPQSEDFFYWAPEEICHYPHPGPEDAWFVTEAHCALRDVSADFEESGHAEQ